MLELCLITYMRENEKFTDELHKISNELYNIYGNKFRVIICCEKKVEIYNKKYDVECMFISGTKYKRLKKVISMNIAEYYISIDNDIFIDCIELINFIKKLKEKNYDVGWGKIGVQKQKNFISNMVVIDKLISHNLKRPISWKLGIGISIPGQIFCIKGKIFKDKMIEEDTFLDDIAIGIFINENKLKKFVTNKILGNEIPNNTFLGLFKQRSRWGLGFSSLLNDAINSKKSKKKIIYHAFIYHFLWLINLFIFTILILFNPILSIIYLIFITLLIVNKSLNMFIYAIMYYFIFPIFHIKWIITVLKNIMKGNKND